jgi:ribonuclease P protein component
MIPKRSRLPSASFRGSGYRTVGTPYFSLKIRPNGEQRERIGVVVNTAVHKSAAKRNFWKRQAKATITGRHGGAKDRDGHDLLLILFSKVNTLTKKQFKEKLSEALERAER